MSHRAANSKTDKKASNVLEFGEGKRAFLAAREKKNAQTRHEAAEAALMALKESLASENGIHPELERMREKLGRAASSVRVQLENRQALASDMADVNVVLDMSEFVRQQILFQAPLFELSQPNTLAVQLLR